jgi:hypothetical protein
LCIYKYGGLNEAKSLIIAITKIKEKCGVLL